MIANIETPAIEAPEETEPIMILDPEQEELGKRSAKSRGIFRINILILFVCRSESRKGWQD